MVPGVGGSDDFTGEYQTIGIATKLAIITALLIGLTGCFKSGEALINADNADFPFTTLTYVEAGGDDKITLERDGDRYLNIAENEGAYVRLQTISENLYVVQITTTDSGQSSYLYGLIRVAPDRKSFEIVKGFAGSGDLEAARQGQPGLSVCDDDMICVESLKSYVDYARAAPAADNPAKFQILVLE